LSIFPGLFFKPIDHWLLLLAFFFCLLFTIDDLPIIGLLPWLCFLARMIVGHCFWHSSFALFLLSMTYNHWPSIGFVLGPNDHQPLLLAFFFCLIFNIDNLLIIGLLPWLVFGPK